MGETFKDSFMKAWRKCHSNDVFDSVKYNNGLEVRVIGEVKLIGNQEFWELSDEFNKEYLNLILYGNSL